MSRLRAVLDTNCVLSALLFSQGRLAWLRAAWRDGLVLPLVSQATTAELLRVLAYPKFRLGPDEREDLLAEYLPLAETVPIPAPPPAVPPLADAADRPFLELALAGEADALVSGDRAILATASAFPIPILTPAELRAKLGLAEARP